MKHLFILNAFAGKKARLMSSKLKSKSLSLVVNVSLKPQRVEAMLQKSPEST